MELRKVDYLEQLEKDAKSHASLKSSAGQKRLVKQLAVLSIAAVVFTGIGLAGTKYQRESAYASGTAPVFENLGYKDNFERLKQLPIGNDINVLMDGGNIISTEDVHAASFQANGFQQIAGASYLNEIDHHLIYRDDKDRHIYIMQPNGQKKVAMFNGNAGEVYCVGGHTYFIDFGNQSRVEVLDSGSDEPRAITKESVKSFAVCNDSIVYLTTGNVLKHQALKNDTGVQLANNIQSFFLNGDIVAQSGKNIIKFTTSGELPEKVYTSSASDFRLLGATKDAVYFQEDGLLVSLAQGERTEWSKNKHTLYKSLLVVDENNIYVVVQDSQNGVPKNVLVNLKRG